MPASRKRGAPPAKGIARGGPRHHAHDGAPVERWALLGRELHARRLSLGYTTRVSFAIAKGLITANGEPNRRMIISVENNERQNYAPGRLEQFALAYEVTKESVYALLDGKTDELEPARPAAPPAAVPLATSDPFADPVRAAAVRPFFDEINERRVALAARGITDPSGDQMFPDAPDDAKAWDGIGRRMPPGDRAWFIAELRRLAAARNRGSDDNASSPGA